MAIDMKPKPFAEEGTPSVVMPPQLPAFMELQIDAATLGTIVMQRMRAETICCGQTFALSQNGPTVVLDHVEFASPARLGGLPPAPAQEGGSGGPGGGTGWLSLAQALAQLPGEPLSPLRLIVPVALYLKAQDQLLDPTTSDEYLPQLTADVYCTIDAEDGWLGIRYDTLRVENVALTAEQIAAISSGFPRPKLRSPIDVSALSHLLGPLSVSEGRVGADAELTVLSVRLRLGTSQAGQDAWPAFAHAPVESFLAGRQWALRLDSRLVVGVAEGMVRSMMASQQGLQLSSLDAQWTPMPLRLHVDDVVPPGAITPVRQYAWFAGGVVIDMEGDDWLQSDAELPCDIGFQATAQAVLTVPAANQLSLDVGFDLQPSAFDLALCLEGGSPIGLGYLPDLTDLPSACVQARPYLIHCHYSLQLPALTFGSALPIATMTLTDYTPSPQGPILGGSMQVASFGNAALSLQADDFAWGVLGSCGHYHVGAVATLHVGAGTEQQNGKAGPPLARPVALCAAPQVLQDGAGVFTPLVRLDPWNAAVLPVDITVEVTTGDIPPDSPYWTKPYPLVLLVTTSAGIQAVSLGKVPAISPEDYDGLAASMGIDEANCDAPQDGLFGIPGLFDPHWLVDPGPERGARLWEGIVTGAVPGDAFQLADGHGTIARSLASASGTAELAGIVPTTGPFRVTRTALGAAPPARELVHAGVAASGAGAASQPAPAAHAGAGAPPAEVSAPPRLRERHTVMLRRARLDAGAQLRSVGADRLGGSPLALLGADDGVSIFDVSRPVAPRLVARAARARGALAFGAEIVYWGEQGAAYWSRPAPRGEPILACARIGESLAALTPTGVALLDRELRTVAALELVHQHAFVVVRRMLAVLVPDGVALVDLFSAIRPTLLGTSPVPGASALSRWSGARLAPTLAVQTPDGYVTFEVTRPPALTPIVTWERRPWAFGAARVGDLWVRPEEPDAAVLYSPGPSRSSFLP